MIQPLDPSKTRLKSVESVLTFGVLQAAKTTKLVAQHRSSTLRDSDSVESSISEAQIVTSKLACSVLRA